EKLAASVGRLARASLEDVYAAVGRGEMRSDDVVKAVHPEWTGPRPEERAALKGEGWYELEKGQSLKFKIPGIESDPDPLTAIPIRGINRELPVRFAPNGGAVPGDRIVGILSPGEGITIYPIQSPALQDFEEEPERWLDVRWDVEEDDPQRFPVQIVVVATNEPGSLAQIAQVIGERDGNIDNLRMSSRSADFTRMVIDIGVYDLRHLNGILTDLRARPVVSSVERVNG
ncbi:MAG: bifunctional (p)ppGpp synthetase/guanosine-3',5'-bis(diphosphate) 3'-pyrophosphohydrolase, partial [Starkeya sp.]|nr:bifunctional (p)ppGpp synthetase/guanosine-3',5'-bis(diphosphate) 3'-pyrophosphohydrolase [Starkeya sp.]